MMLKSLNLPTMVAIEHQFLIGVMRSLTFWALPSPNLQTLWYTSHGVSSFELTYNAIVRGSMGTFGIYTFARL